jgi:repressor LexA
LKHWRKKGFVGWAEDQARTIQILKSSTNGIPVYGAIAAGGLVEPYADEEERLDISSFFQGNNHFALRVTGDSMIEDLITEGDWVIMQPVPNAKAVKNGTIVAARVEGQGTTLKRYHIQGDKVTLKPANPKYQPIEAKADRVELQGTLVGIWRGY